MQFITIGKPPEYLRLSAVRRRPDNLPEHLPREKRRYLDAELRIHDLTATARIDLMHEYAGLVQFFDQVVAHWPEWNNSFMVWGRSSALQFQVDRGPRPSGGPDHFRVTVKLHNSRRHTYWRVETLLILSPEELEAIARDLHRLTD
ncbi:DUF6228 family protein [Kribbella speibonae]|uniref:Uncharacterized protein n=1 Tax=Kribbella speibonae TaxID=1572660 RepID=A0A4V2M2T5_9ACTN|nr:DUF6228 family protein [Kribbella speibonae]TCC29422.1 hypothetical protein E0H92_41040 [Kribbella speibonae]